MKASISILTGQVWRDKRTGELVTIGLPGPPMVLLFERNGVTESTFPPAFMEDFDSPMDIFIKDHCDGQPPEVVALICQAWATAQTPSARGRLVFPDSPVPPKLTWRQKLADWFS